MSNLISEYRKAAGLSQTDLAKAAGWRPSRLSNYETGYRVPDINDCRAICAAFASLGVDVDLGKLFPSEQAA